MKKYIINVTKEDIQHGQQSNARSCPVALAIRRDVKLNTVIVGGDTIMLYWPNKKILFWEIPATIKYRPVENYVLDFIDKFDSGKEVKPFSFELEV